jgi:phosphoglycolate phosphatase
VSRPPRAVLFDLDGTLVDTAPDLAAATNRMLEARSRPALPVSQLRPYVSSGARGMIGRAFGIAPGEEGYESLRAEFIAVYEQHLCVHSALFPGMEELLARIEAQGVPWGVVTNKAHRLAHPILTTLGIHTRSAVLVGGDTCARAKPHPDPLLHAAREIGIEPAAALYVGDDIRDIQAARAAGMPALAAEYGYLGDGEGPHAWGAEAVVSSPLQIAHWCGW